MNKIIRTLMIAVLMAGTACTSLAQEDDKKIKIKITKEVNGDTKTFEAEYESEEEMRNDPNYQEFSGDDDNFAFYFDNDDLHEQVIQLYKNGSGVSTFSFSTDDDDSSPFRVLRNFQFKGGHGPKVWAFGDDDSDIDVNIWNSEEYEEEMEEKMEELEEKLKDVDESLREEIMEAMREIEEISAGGGLFPKRIKRGGVSVSSVGDEFGKRGKVEEKDKLKLDDINYTIMQKNLSVRLKIKEEGELTMKISNKEGKEIYNRYFERFGGTFSDTIDFSKYSEGDYLLEISRGKKRLTKKIVID